MTRLSAALALAAGALLAAPPLRAQEPAPLARIMSAEERARTGVDRLGPDERAALEAWLARYTATVAAAARSLPEEPRVSTLPPFAGPVIGRALAGQRVARHAGLPGAVEIADVLDDGTFIRLADGTMWEVYLPDRPYTVGWRRGDWVVVRRLSAPVQGFEGSLTNASARSAASVRFAGIVASRAGRLGGPRDRR
jgi:hypothetical protein